MPWRSARLLHAHGRLSASWIDFEDGRCAARFARITAPCRLPEILSRRLPQSDGPRSAETFVMDMSYCECSCCADFSLAADPSGAMWYLMENAQRSYTLSERLLRAIGHHSAPGAQDEQEDVEELIRQGADVNQSHGNLLPLHCACMVGDASSVAVLLKWGADVNRYDGYHRTALHHAAERSPQCVSLLLAAGADTESIDMNQGTPLHWAAFRNRADCCRLLLEHRAHVDSLDFNHDTPLSWAAMKGNYQSVRILLEYNASPDVRNYNGMVPLARIAMLLAAGLESADDKKAFELLLRGMGHVELRDRDGELPAILAHDNKLHTQLLAACCSPRSLAQLGRHAVRRYLGAQHLPTIVPLLPVPGRLQRFLLLDF